MERLLKQINNRLGNLGKNAMEKYIQGCCGISKDSGAYGMIDKVFGVGSAKDRERSDKPKSKKRRTE